MRKDIKEIPIDIIQQSVSEATKIPLDIILLPNRVPGSRKREIVSARQISMSLCKKLTKCSLSKIGFEHTKRDHATVLHAVNTINDLIDTKDYNIIDSYSKALDLIYDWNDKRVDTLNKLTLSQLRQKKYNLETQIAEINRQISNRTNVVIDSRIVKMWIKNKVPLHVRETFMKVYLKVYKP